MTDQQPATCVGCEGNPAPENNPCAVCGQQPAADPLVEWANSPLNFTATVGVFKDGVQQREDECLTLDHWRMRAYDLEANWSRCSRACAGEQTKREQAEALVEELRAEREIIGAEAIKYADKSGRLQAKVDQLAEALRWYVENDDTNEGQEGNEYWLAGRDRAIAVLSEEEVN